MQNTTTRSDLGSVRRLQSGKWLARITHGMRVDGKPDARSKTFATEQGAWDWIRTERVRMGAAKGVTGLTLSALWQAYESVRLPELAKSTQALYRQRMCKVVDAIGSRKVEDITHGDIQRLLDTMRPVVAKRTAAALSAVLTFGVRNGLVTENVMRRAPFSYPEESPFAEPDADVWDDDPFAAIEQRRDVWDMRTALACMERIRGLPLEPVFLACVGAGLRVEEAFALRKMDVRRVVGSYDEWGHEIWVTQLAVHHATTREESRKSTKTARSVGIVPMLEPFGERFWELVQACAERGEAVCKLSAARQNKAWRSYFDKPPETWHKRMGESRKVRGALYGLPYIPLSRMRATHTTYMQEQGVSDSLNQRMHRNTGAVQLRHYMEPDTTQAAAELSRRIR